MPNQSFAHQHANRIVAEWQSGKTVTELTGDYCSSPRTIKGIIVDKVGIDEYNRINRKRTGAGAKVRRRHPHYPDWMKVE